MRDANTYSRKPVSVHTGEISRLAGVRDTPVGRFPVLTARRNMTRREAGRGETENRWRAEPPRQMTGCDSRMHRLQSAAIHGSLSREARLEVKNRASV